MLSRSAKVAAQGRALLSPLSPLPSPLTVGYASISTTAQLALDNHRRVQQSKAAKKPAVSSRLEISGPTSPKVMSPTTAAAMGFDSTIMERLQDVLASPFSPKTFARSILSPALKTPEPSLLAIRPLQSHSAPPRAQKSAANRQHSLKPRRKAPPSMLNLPEPPRYTEKTPLSPMKYPLLAARAAMKPMSPTRLIAHVSPVTTLSEAQIRRQKMEKLTRCIGESVPKELMYPSFGQVTEQTSNVGSYLDLYRAGASDDTAVGAKSPVPKDAHWEDVALGETKLERSGSQRSLRKSRSVGDFFSVEDIRELRSQNAKMAARQDAQVLGAAQLVISPTGLTSPTNVKPLAPARRTEVETEQLRRKRSIANAKASIIGADAKIMEKFRLGFSASSPVPPMPAVPFSPTPGSPVSSTLLAVKSPHVPVPYWVRPSDPKTPRTRRTERRMGWGGSWYVGSMGEMVTQLKEL